MSKSTRKIKEIYLDYAAATPIDKAVAKEMAKVYQDNFASPTSIHGPGVKAKNILEKARSDIANIFGAHSDEIIFTSGSTESNNLAVLGLIQKVSSPHIVTLNIEHSSVLEVFKKLESTKSAQVTYVAVGPNGVVDPRDIKKSLKPNTVLVSVMYANSEIGTIQPLSEIAKIIRHFNKTNKKNVYFHTDATQALNYLTLRVEKLGVDMMSLSGVKIYGPKGVGALYVKRNVPIHSILFGGNQQNSMRPGSYNLPGIVGLAGALKIVEKIKTKESERLVALRNYFFLQLEKIGEGIIINGDLKERLPNNINITVPGIPSDLLVLELSERGIFVSAKSACKSGDGKASHVLTAINPKLSETDGSIRFSLGRGTSKKDIDFTVMSLSQILKKLSKWYN